MLQAVGAPIRGRCHSLQYDRHGYKNGDKCAWTVGTTYTVANGSRANVKLGSRDYLIQQNWVNANGGYCAMHYPQQ